MPKPTNEEDDCHKSKQTAGKKERVAEGAEPDLLLFVAWVMEAFSVCRAEGLEGEVDGAVSVWEPEARDKGCFAWEAKCQSEAWDQGGQHCAFPRNTGLLEFSVGGADRKLLP